jgi:hypothetical protein
MAAFYFGSDTAIDEETGQELSTQELIAEGRRVRAEMAREDAEMAAMDQAWDDLAEVEALADREVEDRAAYGLAELIHEVSGEDVNGMKARTYRSWCEEVVGDTDQGDRDHYYRTGLMVGTVAEFARFYAR